MHRLVPRSCLPSLMAVLLLLAPAGCRIRPADENPDKAGRVDAGSSDSGAATTSDAAPPADASPAHFPDAGADAGAVTPDAANQEIDAGAVVADAATPDATVVLPDATVFILDGAVMDGAVVVRDAALFMPDGAVMGSDAATSAPDGASHALDAMVDATDAAEEDASTPTLDAGTVTSDAGGLTTGSLVRFRTVLKGAYLMATYGGGARVDARSVTAGAWETFRVVDLNGGDMVSGDSVQLVASSGQYVTALNGGGGVLTADRTSASGWETFILRRIAGAGVVQSGDEISLCTVLTGQYVSAAEGGGGDVTADRTAVSGWEAFIIESAPTTAMEGVVQHWLTTGDQKSLLTPQPRIALSMDPLPPGSTVIDVEPAKTRQVIDGFGAAMTESSAWLMATRMTATQRKALVADLFDPHIGAGLSSIRVPMGASDFALDDYTYDDLFLGEDLELTRFNITRDLATVVPMIKEALTLNPEVFIIGSPWSAPAWMKTNRSTHGGSLRSDRYQVYANYFLKFIQAYAEQGIPVHAVTMQNEPHHATTSYPSMRMEAADQAGFADTWLGPLFAREQVNTRILAWDHNWDEPDYALSVFAATAANPYVTGAAFHCYGGSVDAQSTVHDAYPTKDIYFTECSGGEWSPNFANNLVWDVQTLIVGATRHWARTVLTWNLALDEFSGPTNGGCGNCRGVVTVPQASGKPIRNVEYFALGHGAKFVKPGAFYVVSSELPTLGISNVAFRNRDGSLVLVAVNSSSTMRSFSVREGSRSFTALLPAGSVATYLWM